MYYMQQLLTCGLSFLGYNSSHNIPATNLLDLPAEVIVQIAQELDNRNLGHLNQAAQRTQAITQEILKQRHEQWLFEHRVTVNCSNLRNNHPDVDGFINAASEKLVLAHTAHPGRWFELDLSFNNLGNLSENDLQRIFDNICQTAESLKIHLVSLNLSCNQLQTLPNNIFDNLGNLQRLLLHNNQLQTLPNNIFDNLGNLQELYLFYNQLQTLPNNIFDNLGNLQRLLLHNNQLQTLPNNIFDNLGNLQRLLLHNNQLQTLPNNIFDNLGNLQELYLFYNQLQTLPNNIFDSLGNLQWLWLSSNQLNTLPNNIFDRLGNLQKLWLYNNQLDHETQNALQAFHAARPGINISF